MTVLALLLLLVGAMVLFHRTRDPRFPPLVLCLVWAGAVAAYLLAVPGGPGLRGPTLGAIFLGLACFTLGCFASLARPFQETEASLPPEPLVGPLLLWVLTLGLPFILQRAWALARSGPTENVFLNLRLASLEASQGASSPLDYLFVLAMVLLPMHLGGLVQFPRWMRRWLVLLTTIYLLASTGRTFMLMVLVQCGVILLTQKRVKLLPLLAYGSLAFLALFGLVALLRGQMGEGSGGLLNSLWAYGAGGLAGFDDFLRQPPPLTLGSSSLRTPLALAARLGMPVQVPDLVMEFRDVPFPTNVYTVFRPYFQDFGWAGIALSQALFGLGHGYAYGRSRSGDPTWTFLVGLLWYALVMQPFQDQYFLLMSTWLQIAFLVLLVRLPALVRRAGEAHEG